MEAEKIEVIKNWPKSKLVCNIQVFLGFANFYLQFIQGFNGIAISLTLMLKMIRLLDEPAFSRNNGSKLASSENNNNRLASRKNDGKNEVNRFSIGRNSIEYTKKLRKLSKSKKLKGK